MLYWMRVFVPVTILLAFIGPPQYLLIVLMAALASVPLVGRLVLSVLPAALITGQVAGDGRSDWLKGVQLLAVYLILGLAYCFTPDVSIS